MEAVLPHLKSHIEDLVYEVGSFDTVENVGTYRLGKDAQHALHQLRMWVMLQDAPTQDPEEEDEELEKRRDIGRSVCGIIADTTFITADIPEILSQWERGTGDGVDESIVTAALDLLLPLMRPVHAPPSRAAYAAAMISAQKRYKRAILTNPQHNILTATFRLAVPPMQKDPRDREPRDEWLIAVPLLLLRNLLSIDDEGGEADDLGRASTVLELARQNALEFLTVIAAGLNTNFRHHETMVLECLFYLLQGVDADNLFSPLSETEKLNHDLGEMLNVEAQMNGARFHPTRHSRFGTLISLYTSEDSKVSVSGQRGIAGDAEQTMRYVDAQKKWQRPRQRRRLEHEPWSTVVSLGPEAGPVLQKWAARFLDAAFNPCFRRLRKLFDDEIRGSERHPNHNEHRMCYSYLIGWFLRAELRRGRIDFGLIGEAITPEAFDTMFGLLHKGREKGVDQNNDLVQAAMIGVRHMLLAVWMMGRAPKQELKDTAMGIKARVFYREIWLDELARIPRDAARHTLAYACECVSLIHILLKMLDEYSKQHNYLLVKSQRRKKNPTENDDLKDYQEAARITQERKLELDKYIRRFLHETVVDLYEKVLENYREVPTEHLRHVLSFFHRTFIQLGEHVLFWRISLVRTLLQVCSARTGLTDHELRRQFEKFLSYFYSKLRKALARSPVLFFEILFEKQSYEMRYLQSGEAPSGLEDHTQHAQHDYEFTEALPIPRRMQIVVGALLARDKSEWCQWTQDTLAAQAELPEDQQLRTRVLTHDRKRLRMIAGDAMFRLLLSSAGVVFADKPLVPASLEPLTMVEAAQAIQEARSFGTAVDGDTALDYIRVAGSHTSEAELEDAESEEDNGFNDPRLRAVPGAHERKNRVKRRREVVSVPKRNTELDSDSSEGLFVDDDPGTSPPVEKGHENIKRRRLHVSDSD